MTIEKTESDGKHPASHYLIVESPQKPATWHLRFKDAAGKVDHGLLGAAWAALHSGFRGNQYQGPSKAEAITKLTALYKSEKMPLPGSNGKASMKSAFATLMDSVVPHSADPVEMSDTATITADFAEVLPVTTDNSDFVVRTGKLFQCGEYEDKGFSFDADDLTNAVAAFQPCEVDLEHIPSVLSGKLGTVQRIFAGDDGQSLMGEVHLPRWLDSMLDAGNRKVSATWNRSSKTLQGLALVRNPRVSDAALMAAFSESAEFANTRHNTQTGQMSLQRIHNDSVQGGAVCNRTAAMASQHESSAIQKVHDLTASHGATCERVGQSMPLATYNDEPPTTTIPAAKWSKKHMNIREWLTGKAQEEGVEFDHADLDAAFSTVPPAELAEIKTAMQAKDSEIAELRKSQEQHAAAFARVATERRQADAVTFAQTRVRAHKVTPGAAEKLAVLVERISAADATATFAEGEATATALLQAFVDALPDLSVFTTDSIQSDQAAALFNVTTTPVTDKNKPNEEMVKKLLAATPDGRAILKARQSAN